MRALWLGLLLHVALGHAQDSWRDAGMPHSTAGVRQVFFDDQQDSLIAVGYITEAEFNDYGTPSILSYRHGTWNTIVTAQGTVSSVARYADTLLVAGNIMEIGGVEVRRVGAYYNGAWHSYGEIGGEVGDGIIRKLKVVDGALYAVGSFNQADGHPANGIVKRENGHWVPLGNLQTDSDPILTDVIEYQGDIYVCGALSLAPGGENGIARFDGTSWTAPGGGILGGNAGGLCMAIYQDELVLGGTIHRSAGNPGHMIMRWNGEEWRGLGGHLRDQNNDTIGEARCYALLSYEDKLLVAGGFWYAGGVPASRFAIWDGEDWCGTGDEWEGYGESLAMFDDTLFMASGYKVNGMPVNRIAKWVGGPIEGSACTTVGMQDYTEGTRIQVASFGGGRFNLSGLCGTNVIYRVMDPTGRTVQQGHTQRTDRLELDLSPYGPGVYGVHLSCHGMGGRAIKLVNSE